MSPRLAGRSATLQEAVEVHQRHHLAAQVEGAEQLGRRVRHRRERSRLEDLLRDRRRQREALPVAHEDAVVAARRGPRLRLAGQPCALRPARTLISPPPRGRCRAPASARGPGRRCEPGQRLDERRRRCPRPLPARVELAVLAASAGRERDEARRGRVEREARARAPRRPRRRAPRTPTTARGASRRTRCGSCAKSSPIVDRDHVRVRAAPSGSRSRRGVAAPDRRPGRPASAAAPRSARRVAASRIAASHSARCASSSVAATFANEPSSRSR